MGYNAPANTIYSSSKQMVPVCFTAAPIGVTFCHVAIPHFSISLYLIVLIGIYLVFNLDFSVVT